MIGYLGEEKWSEMRVFVMWFNFESIMLSLGLSIFFLFAPYYFLNSSTPFYITLCLFFLLPLSSHATSFFLLLPLSSWVPSPMSRPSSSFSFYFLCRGLSPLHRDPFPSSTNHSLFLHCNPPSRTPP